MHQPLVSVICLCYNHEPFVEACIASVQNQTYGNLEIIIVDDASTDGSKAVIDKLVRKNPEIKFVDLKENIGNCKAFNRGLVLATGEFIVDLATDDVFLPNRIEKQLETFDQLDKDYGVLHTDAIYIDEAGEQLKTHKKYLLSKGIIDHIPNGDIYKEVLERFFIAGPTMLVKRKVFEDLGGYDEELDYEDFDFWVRSARKWKYHYLDEQLTKIRKVKGSKSTGWYKRGDKQLHSTYLVCRKAKKLNKNEAEDKALANRLKFEIRQSVFSENLKEARLFYGLLKELGYDSPAYELLIILARLHLPLAPLRKLYHRLRY